MKAELCNLKQGGEGRDIGGKLSVSPFPQPFLQTPQPSSEKGPMGEQILTVSEAPVICLSFNDKI